MSPFEVPCNGAAARYNDIADGPVARVTGSGQRYTPRVGGSSLSTSAYSLFTRAKRHRTPTVNTVMTRSSVAGGDFSISFRSFKTFNEFQLNV